MVAMPRMLLLGALAISGAALAFLVGARAGAALDRTMVRAHAPPAAVTAAPPKASLAAARIH
jgi:hypothetical protein